MKFPTLPGPINWKNDAEIFRAFNREDMQSFMKDWSPCALITLGLFSGQTTVREFNNLVHRFLCDLDPGDKYRQETLCDYARNWSEEGGIGQISFGDGLVHAHLKFMAFARQYDNNPGGWTGILFRNHADMRSQIYPVIRLAYNFSLWLQNQGIEHSITLLSANSEFIDVELPTGIELPKLIS